MSSPVPNTCSKSIPPKRPATAPDRQLARNGPVSSQRRLDRLAFLQGCLLLFLAGLGLASMSGLIDTSDSVFSASWLLTIIAVWHFYSWRLAGQTLFEPYGLFLLAATLFNAGQGILEALHLNEDGILSAEDLSPALIVQALYLVALGLASLHFGALVALATGRAKRLRQTPPAPDWRLRRVAATRLVGYACLVLSVAPLFFVLQDALTIAFTQGYAALFGRPLSELLPSSVQILANFVMPGAMFAIAGSNRKKVPVAVGSAFLLVYAGSMLAVGSRSATVMSLVAFAWTYNHWVRRLPRGAILAAGAILLATFPLIHAIRDTPGSWQNSSEVLQDVVSEQNPLIAAVSEMGGTLKTVAHTIRLIPSVRPFDLGTSYAYAASTILPNVGWQIHPANAHGLLADWLVWAVRPAMALVGGGLGFSFLAEAYANFGWFGLIPTVALMGYFMARLSVWGTSDDDPAKFALNATFLAFVLFFPRQESASFVRGLAWYSFLPYAAVSLIAERRSQRRRLVMNTAAA